jgi:hypothetical protein
LSIYVTISFRLFENAGLEMCPELCTSLIDELIHTEEAIRKSASLGLGQVLEEYPDHCAATLSMIFDKYEDMLYVSSILVLLLGIFRRAPLPLPPGGALVPFYFPGSALPFKKKICLKTFFIGNL